MKRNIFCVAIVFLAGMPIVAHAQFDSGYLVSIMHLVEDVLAWSVPVLIGIAFVWFLYNVFVYMIKSDPDSKEGARTQMIYGIIGLAIMIGVWGLVRIVTNFFGVSNSGSSIPAPRIPNL